MPLRGTSRRATDLPSSTEGHAPRFFAIADELIQPGPELSAAERLELYHRQYWFRILDSLAEDFPTLQSCIGGEQFWSDAERYLLQHPSTSFTLRHLGAGLANFYTNDEATPQPRRHWLADLARLEYAHMEVFEKAQACLPDATTILHDHLVLQSHVLVIRVRYPVDQCWSDPAIFDQPTEADELDVAVWRGLNGESFHRRLDTDESLLLAQLQQGGTLSDILARLPEPMPSAEFIRDTFGQWQHDGWIGIHGTTMTLPLGEQHQHWQGMDRMSSETRAMED